MREAGVRQLTANTVQNARGASGGPQPGQSIPWADLGSVIRGILREEFWCRLESQGAYLHFGWDFYLYVGVPCPCPEATTNAAARGLFVESCRSPYRDIR